MGIVDTQLTSLEHSPLHTPIMYPLCIGRPLLVSLDDYIFPANPNYQLALWL